MSSWFARSWCVTRALLCAGLTVPIERKRELYAICSEYDVIIIEDDPYYYLQFGVRGELTCRNPQRGGTRLPCLRDLLYSTLTALLLRATHPCDQRHVLCRHHAVHDIRN